MKIKHIPENEKPTSIEYAYAKSFVNEYVRNLGARNTFGVITRALLQDIVLDISTVPPIVHLGGRSFCDLFGEGFIEVVRNRDRWEQKDPQ